MITSQKYIQLNYARFFPIIKQFPHFRPSSHCNAFYTIPESKTPEYNPVYLFQALAIQNIINSLNINFKITMTTRLFLLLCLLMIIHCQINQTNPYKRSCMSFSNGGCLTCPYNYHMYQNQCYLNITGCQQYTTNSSGYFVCSACDSAISRYDGAGGCLLTVTQQELTNSAYLQQVSANYGDLRFISVSLAEAQNNFYFRLANSYMLNGNYKHFISQTVQPIQSVSTFNIGEQIQFKILYSGSGGGLMLCLISVTTSNNALQLSSFVPIGITSVVDNCDQYSMSVQCLQCLPGYHLQNSVCYIDVQNCISYSQNICIQCSGASLLIQNRCVTPCSEMSDLNSITFYGDFRYYMTSNSPQLLQISRAYLLF